MRVGKCAKSDELIMQTKSAPRKGTPMVRLFRTLHARENVTGRHRQQRELSCCKLLRMMPCRSEPQIVRMISQVQCTPDAHQLRTAPAVCQVTHFSRMINIATLLVDDVLFARQALLEVC